MTRLVAQVPSLGKRTTPVHVAASGIDMPVNVT